METGWLGIEWVDWLGGCKAERDGISCKAVHVSVDIGHKNTTDDCCA